MRHTFHPPVRELEPICVITDAGPGAICWLPEPATLTDSGVEPGMPIQPTSLVLVKHALDGSQLDQRVGLVQFAAEQLFHEQLPCRYG